MNEQNQIEMTFYNQSSAELNIEYVDLIIETPQNTNMNLSLFKEDSQTDRSFKIDSKRTNKFKFNFKYQHLEQFKIIGYEINTLKSVNRIMFEELAQPEISKLRNTKKIESDSIRQQYDIEMIPKLPVIIDLRFFYDDSNNSLVYSNLLSQSKNLTINCKLGTR